MLMVIEGRMIQLMAPSKESIEHRGHELNLHPDMTINIIPSSFDHELFLTVWTDGR